MSINYHTQHSPFGAFASFTIGKFNTQGGFGQSLGGPGNQQIYIGSSTASANQWSLLPFFQSASTELEAYVGEDGAGDKKNDYLLYPQSAISRNLGWASDSWTAASLRFTIYSPFDHVDDPSTLNENRARFLFAPLQIAEISYDNSAGDEDVELIFGMAHTTGPTHPVSDSMKGYAGTLAVEGYGYAAKTGDGVRDIQGLSVLKQEFADPHGYHRIGNQSAILITVPKGHSRTVPITIAFYQPGMVTTGIPTRFYYTRFFNSLTDVLRYGLEHANEYIDLARKRDGELLSSKLSADQQFLLAQATHSYLGSSQLLDDEGKPLWIVNEGEYRMMNTFDLTVDHLFFELEWWPWAMRNVLDQFTSRYSYRDELHNPDGQQGPGGITFTHDMGVYNQFSPLHHSSYECVNLEGCFSHMTCEQLVNWICCAVTYAEKTGDSHWLSLNRQTLIDCAQSLHHRDDPDPAIRNGIMGWDSNRCGLHGSEITTYDSLDVSLGQSRNNLYLAVKTLGAWLLLERAFQKLGLQEHATDASATADLAIQTLCSLHESDTGFFPAVFEKGNQSRILPAVEGLVFPLVLGMEECFQPGGKLEPLLHLLRTHMKQALVRGICLDEKSGGWKLSSTSTNTWFSKIAISQHVTRKLFPEIINAEITAADAVHVAWQQGPCGHMAMCDQIDSRNGKPRGSMYYPRGVTAFLWLSE